MSGRAWYVFDMNTLVSTVSFEHSTPGQALRRALKRGGVLILPTTLEELAEVLQREKFDLYVTAAEREEFLEAFVERANFMKDSANDQTTRVGDGSGPLRNVLELICRL